MDDLLAFSRALHGGGLVSDDVLTRFTDFSQEMQSGIHYGLGMVQFRFTELSPLLFTRSDLHGAVGASGTFALYDPINDRPITSPTSGRSTTGRRRSNSWSSYGC